jgi:glutamine amidotransferase
MKVVVVDYGMGNLYSVRRALEVAGASDIEVSPDPAALDAADRAVLPGVGAFRDGMEELSRAGFVDPLRRYAASGRPLLGICLGMQMLCDRSEEFGETPGLGLIPGRVVQMAREGAGRAARKLPYIGWAPLTPGPLGYQGTCLAGMGAQDSVYFLHSFQAEVAGEDLLASYDYAGLPVTAAIARDNVTGLQFHPEKSGPTGLAILKRFLAG